MAEAHLQESLRLAEICHAPYERALTLIALAELRRDMGLPNDARRNAEDARAVCTALGALPALSRLDAIATGRSGEPGTASGYPCGLTDREVDVLRLVAAGMTNVQVAEQLFVSRRTIDQHLRSIYGRLGVSSRAAATRFAVEHGLT
jgi:DNA-binding NarL/FixJ family response regulator